MPVSSSSIASRRKAASGERNIRIDRGFHFDVVSLVDAFQQLDDVGDVAMAARPELELEKSRKPDHIGVSGARGESLRRRICVAETSRHWRPLYEEIHPNSARDVSQARDAQALKPELRQRRIQSLRPSGFDEHVDDLGRARVPMMNHGHAPNES